MKKTTTKFLTPFRFVVPADYERWFEKLALKGWHPKKASHWNSMKMTFEKGEPQKYCYIVDVQAIPKTDYKATYEAFGWEFVGQMSSIFIWRKPYTDERPISFSDPKSLAERNSRFIKAISFSFTIFLVATLIVFICFILNFNGLTLGGYIQFALGLLLSGGFTIYLGYVMRKISKNRDE